MLVYRSIFFKKKICIHKINNYVYIYIYIHSLLTDHLPSDQNTELNLALQQSEGELSRALQECQRLREQHDVTMVCFPFTSPLLPPQLNKHLRVMFLMHGLERVENVPDMDMQLPV